jgi:flavin-dependent dehydrogenase
MSGVTDVVVVGAGPAGSATAALLAEAGVRVTLLERAAFPRPKPCAEYLSPEAGRILERLGVFDQLARRAARLAGMRIVSPGGRSFVGRFTSALGFVPFRPWGLALPREILDATLAKAAVAHGAVLEERTTVTSFAASRTGVEARLRSGPSTRTVRAALLVGADGLRSHVAAALGVARTGGRRRVALVGHAVGVGGMTDVAEMHVARGAYVGLASVGDGVTNVAAVLDPAALPSGPDAQARLERVLGRFPALTPRFAQARFVAPVLATGPFDRRTTRATADAVALVGDAADFYDPFTGEGIFAALRGAELLVPHLLRALDTGRLERRALAGYDRDRRRAFGGKWLLERAIGAAVATPVLLDHLAARLARRPDLANLLVGATGDFIPARRVFSPRVALGLVA